MADALHEPSVWGSVIDATALSENRQVDWVQCQFCGFKSKGASGLHLHISRSHGVSAWVYYHFYPYALQSRIRHHVELLDIGMNLGECWNFQGRPTSGKGYRTMKVVGAPTFAVHRLSVFAFTGSLPPPTRLVLHACDNTQCCNPKHLGVGSHMENMVERCHRGRTLSGSQVWNAAFTEDEVHDVRQHASWGWSTVEIASHFGVNSRAVRRLLAGTTYRDIPVRDVEIPW